MSNKKVCNSDCEWCVLNCTTTTKESYLECECTKYAIPIKFGDICRDEYDVFTPLNNALDDQKEKADYGKAKLSLVPRRIIWDIAAIREYGNNKYQEGGPDNWKKVDAQRYRDALYRHLMYYLDDPNGVDKESGFPHLWHLACNVAFLCELEDEKIKEK